MSKGEIACCLMCHVTFPSHEELFHHSCTQIKVESSELQDEKPINTNGKLLETFDDQEDFKYDMEPPDEIESDSDYSPSKKKIKKSIVKKKEKKNKKSTKVDGKKKEIARKSRNRPKVEYNEDMIDEAEYQKQLDLALCNSSNLDLSEEFIIFILKQVDELCENIKIGDPDIKRVVEIHQGLNNVVSCYRNKLSPEKQILIKSEALEHYTLDDFNVLDPDNGMFEEIASDNDYVPEKVQKGKKKMGRPRKACHDKNLELVKKSCGGHSVREMSLMLNINYCTLKVRILKEKIDYGTNKGECQLCEMKKSNDGISKDMLFQFMKFNTDHKKNIFKCSLCTFTARKRGSIFTHIKSLHKNEIISSTNSKIEFKYDCGNSECKILYGVLEGKKFWCTKCNELAMLPQPRKRKFEIKEKSTDKTYKLCPECGMSVTNLKHHLNNVHYVEKQTCSSCGKMLKSLIALKTHMKQEHEKVPCAQCGKLYGSSAMTRHIHSAHTPNDQKKFRCDVCGKGFSNSQNLQDHNNIHTGEKPYKCKFCSASFASKGTHAMHQRGHLGHRRNSSKVI